MSAEFPISRFMRLVDYKILAPELRYVDRIVNALGGWNPVQHQCRRWEYALALKAAEGRVTRGSRVADFGCGIGLLSPMLCSMGAHMVMYEPWVYGNEEDKARGQMAKIMEDPSFQSWKTFEFYNGALCNLAPHEKNFDAAFCISTLEHIGEYERAFRDMCQSVPDEGGLIFLTTDAAEDEEDHYQYSFMRAGRMFNWATYTRLVQLGEEEGFELLDGVHNWEWAGECRMVNDYGFGSLAMIRRRV